MSSSNAVQAAMNAFEHARTREIAAVADIIPASCADPVRTLSELQAQQAQTEARPPARAQNACIYLPQSARALARRTRVPRGSRSQHLLDSF